MKIADLESYLVGGAVRDELLHLPVTERDYVVVGANTKQMLDLGFQQVGSDFPVFLHPMSKEEYALARVERKVAKGYGGFSVEVNQSVTLEQDLLRRDLTINAIAKDIEGNIIDPYNGQEDLQNRILRHVSEAFTEDPVRVLRVARFMARFASLGFTVAEETMQLMKEMVSNQEIEALVAERVYKEMSRAMLEATPVVFFETLRACGALRILLPELDALWGVPQRRDYHPEVDTGIHTMMVLSEICKLSDNLGVRFAALFHDLGKARTDKSLWPSHRGHEELGVAPIKAIAKRYKFPNKIKELCIKVARYHLHCHRAKELTPKKILELFKALDAFRNPGNLENFLLSCTADARGRLLPEVDLYPQADYLRGAFQQAQEVTVQDFVTKKLEGKQLGDAIYRGRLTKIKNYKEFHSS